MRFVSRKLAGDNSPTGGRLEGVPGSGAEVEAGTGVSSNPHRAVARIIPRNILPSFVGEFAGLEAPARRWLDGRPACEAERRACVGADPDRAVVGVVGEYVGARAADEIPDFDAP